jgi:hypothetical protein
MRAATSPGLLHRRQELPLLPIDGARAARPCHGPLSPIPRRRKAQRRLGAPGNNAVLCQEAVQFIVSKIQEEQLVCSVQHTYRKSVREKNQMKNNRCSDVESSGASLFTWEHTKYTTHSFPFCFYEVQVIKIRTKTSFNKYMFPRWLARKWYKKYSWNLRVITSEPTHLVF